MRPTDTCLWGSELDKRGASLFFEIKEWKAVLSSGGPTLMSIFLFIPAKYNGCNYGKAVSLIRNAGVPLHKGNKGVQNVQNFENNDCQLSC